MAAGTIDVRRSGERFHTRTGWLDSRHSFSFGPHYDPGNTHHGLLVVSNDDVVAPSSGFTPHSHRDMEIVTWVLDGELEHRDSEGNHDVIFPGLAQRMSAGTGITHSEINASAERPVHLVQMWVLPDATGIPPGYEQRDVSAELEKGGLVAIASGRDHDGAVAIHQREAVLWGGRLRPDERAEVPAAPHAHVYVARGSVDLDGAGRLGTGDAARLTAAGARELVADPEEGAEVLIWETA